MRPSVSIYQHVKEICRSEAFDGAPLRRKFLKHLVAKTEARKKVTEKSVAVKIYERDPDIFDPIIDSIVRVEKKKLQSALTQFYETEGQHHDDRIIIRGFSAHMDWGGGERARVTIPPDVLPPPAPPVIECPRKRAKTLQPPVADPSQYDTFRTRISEDGQVQLPPEFVAWFIRRSEYPSDPPVRSANLLITTSNYETVRIYPAAEASYQNNHPLRWRERRSDEEGNRFERSFKIVPESGWVRLYRAGCLCLPPALSEKMNLANQDAYLWRPKKYYWGNEFLEIGYLALIPAAQWEDEMAKYRSQIAFWRDLT